MTDKHIVFAFGRMNPPTAGHSKLIDTVHSHAQKIGADHKVIVSHSQDKHKNPLTSEHKLHYLNHIHPNTNIEASTKEHPHFLAQLKKFHQEGYTHATMVAGSDRVDDFKKLVHKYNGPDGEYDFKKIHIKSAGARDPDAEGVAGVSGTKMRTHAGNNDLDKFKEGLHSGASHEHATKLFNATRNGMGLKESQTRLSFGAFLNEQRLSIQTT
jgi:hypothetical protein